MTTQAQFWDKIAEKYSRRPIGNMAAYDRTMERTRAWLDPQDHVLEIGCGTGSTALLLAPGVAHVTAADISSEMIRIGREKAQAQGVGNVTFRQAALPADAHAAGTLDVALAFNVLHLVPDPAATLVQIHGQLKPGGLFISKTPCLAGSRGIRWLIRAMQLLGRAPEVTFLGMAQLEEMIAAAGFEIVETGSYPDAFPPNRFLVARKP